jgi:hypothetical protein
MYGGISMIHEAIRELYANACSINGDTIDTVEVWDQDGNLVTLNNDNVVAKMNELIQANPMKMLRMERDRLLKQEVDPIVSNNLRWNDMTTEKQTEWANYRTALLDLPSNQTPVDDDLSNITFPTKPT